MLGPVPHEELTGPRMAVLAQLYRAGIAIPVPQLAAELETTAEATRLRCSFLADHGLARWVRRDDRPEHRVVITTRGEALLRHTREVRASMVEARESARMRELKKGGKRLKTRRRW